MTGKTCMLCMRDDADYVASKVRQGRLQHKGAANELGIPIKDWIVHYETHIKEPLDNAVAKDIEPIKDAVLDKISEGNRVLTDLLGVIKTVHTGLVTEDNKMNLKLISAYNNLLKTVFTGFKDIALLEGDIKAAGTTNIQNNVIIGEKVMSIVMENAPPDFKKLLVTKLKEANVLNAN